MAWPKRYKTCYKFTNAGWQEFANMKEKRYLGAGIMYKNKFHVFGGFDGSSWGQTTEIINIDGVVEYGPEIPVAARQEITSINATVSILSGGTTLTNSHPTWLFNHETQAFSFGPSLLEGRYAHGSATVVDKVTTEKIPIVTGGSGNNGILDSTELLINGMWQSGPPLPKALHSFSMLEIHGDAFIFGGRDTGANYNLAIYQLTCSSGICSWSTLNQALKTKRDSTVAIPVPDNFCT
jgi:hypothetical protein